MLGPAAVAADCQGIAPSFYKFVLRLLGFILRMNRPQLKVLLLQKTAFDHSDLLTTHPRFPEPPAAFPFSILAEGRKRPLSHE